MSGCFLLIYGRYYHYYYYYHYYFENEIENGIIIAWQESELAIRTESIGNRNQVLKIRSVINGLANSLMADI